LPVETASDLGVVSFQTGLALCHDVDVVCQLADDSLVQAADLAVWTRSLGWTNAFTAGTGFQGGASADARRFGAAYLRGLDIQTEWFRTGVEAHKDSTGVAAAPPALAMVSCRLLSLRMLAMMLSEVMIEDTSGMTCKLAQALLGLDPEAIAGASNVDVDSSRIGQPAPLDAVLDLLENPPPMPVFSDDSSSHPAGSRAMEPVRADPFLTQAVEQHVTYEAALGVVLALMANASLRDVTLRYVCHAWRSRYQILRNLLGLPWPSIPCAMRRALLSEVTMLLQVAAWEMRLVQPLRAPGESVPQDLDVVGHQRLDMKHTLAQHLQDVVKTLLAPGESEASPHGSVPFLVGAALRLAAACGHHEETHALRSSSTVCQDPIREIMRACECMCLAPTGNGHLAMCLPLFDPHTFLRLLGRGQASPGSLGLEHTDGFPTATVSRSVKGGAVPSERAALQDIALGNEASCDAHFARAVTQAFSLFMSALLHHLVFGLSPGVHIRDPRVQALRAHIEALLPALGAPALQDSCPIHMELFTSFATAFIMAMQQTEAPAPLSMVQSLFSALQTVALHPLSSLETRHHVHRALLLVSQQMLPDPTSNLTQQPPSEMDDTQLGELRGFVRVLLVTSCSAIDPPPGEYRSLPFHGVALPLLMVLLHRVPLSQLALLFHDSSQWPQLLSLVAAAHAPQAPHASIIRQSRLVLRFNAMSVMAVLCQAPSLAASLFEAGGLTVMLQPDNVKAARVHVAVPGLQALNAVHPGPLLSLLQVLVQVTNALPTHRLLMHNILAWLEQHRHLLLELLQWVSQLPLATSVEPHTSSLNHPDHSLLNSVNGGLHNAALVNAAASTTSIPCRSALRVHCTACLPDITNSTVALAALALNSWFLAGDSTMVMCSRMEDCNKIAALAYHCAVLFSELWASLWVGALKCSAPCKAGEGMDPLWCTMIRLQTHFGPLVQRLATQMCSVTELQPADAVMWDGERSKSSGLHERLGVTPAKPATTDGHDPAMPIAMGSAVHSSSETLSYPSQLTRLTLCMQVLRAWRHDSLTQQLQAFTESHIATWASSQRSSVDALGVPAQRGHQPSPPNFASGIVLQLAPEVRSRTSILCVMVVHISNKLLDLKYVGPNDADSSNVLAGAPHLLFEGSGVEFRLLLNLAEVALHLLCGCLRALATSEAVGGAGSAQSATAEVAGIEGTPLPTALGTPRIMLMVQYLRALRHLSALAGGAVLPLESVPGHTKDAYGCRSEDSATHALALSPVKAHDLGFLSLVAERVEELLLRAQGM